MYGWCSYVAFGGGCDDNKKSECFCGLDYCNASETCNASDTCDPIGAGAGAGIVVGAAAVGSGIVKAVGAKKQQK